MAEIQSDPERYGYFLGIRVRGRSELVPSRGLGVTAVKSGAEAVALQRGLHALDRPGQPALQIVRQLAAERRRWRRRRPGRGQDSACSSEPNGSARTSVTRVVGTGSGSASASLSERPLRSTRLRSGAPSVRSTTTASAAGTSPSAADSPSGRIR